MLTKEQNEALTRVGRGTLMGNLLRAYWIPFFLSADLERDGKPARVRLLGEELVVYRDSEGNVGLLQEQCSHRGASLFFARNEACGLRCVYHGWKYDRAGRCLDMPNEPPENDFKSKIRHPAYRCVERNGVVWTHMGSQETVPALPALEWNVVDPAQTYLWPPLVLEVNFMQALEGEYDSSHATILHAGVTRDVGDDDRAKRPCARFHTVDTDYGVLIGAQYAKGDGATDYWRIYPFMMPFHTVINVNPTYDAAVLFSGHAFVPVDDEHTLSLGFTWHPTRAITDAERDAMKRGFPGVEALQPTAESFLPAHDGPYGRYWPKLNSTNDWGFDYEAQRKGLRWSGVPGIWPQDVAVQRGWGPIADRTKEHLGSADVGQIAMRRRLLEAAQCLRDAGTMPPGAGLPEVYRIRPTQTVLRSEDAASWAQRVVPLVQGPYVEAASDTISG